MKVYVILTKIVCAFPGTGKSYLAKKYPHLILDYDSSRFSWTTTSFGNKVRNPDFPENYIQHIKNMLEKQRYEIIFVSSHLEVREALRRNNIRFTLVYPRLKDKAKYILRYTERGNSEDFIESIGKNWKQWILALQSEINGCENIELTTDYIGDLYEQGKL